MKIVIAPDKFKDSLSAIQVCNALKKGIIKNFYEKDIISCPLADGGDGSLETLNYYLDLKPISLIVNDPLFRPINSTYYLDYLNSKKIINNPTSVRNVSEKFFSSNFFKYMPKTIFTKNFNEIKIFLRSNKKIVIKPINGYAGKNILFLTNKLNKKNIEKYLQKFNHVMVQKYLPKVKNGDKRVFLINGKVKGAIRRLPKKGSILSNISQGGVAHKTSLNSRELKISRIVAKKLKNSNIFFAGIDLVGGFLIGDINVTSPTGLPQYRNLTGKNLAVDFWDELENLK